MDHPTQSISNNFHNLAFLSSLRIHILSPSPLPPAVHYFCPPQALATPVLPNLTSEIQLFCLLPSSSLSLARIPLHQKAVRTQSTEIPLILQLWCWRLLREHVAATRWGISPQWSNPGLSLEEATSVVPFLHITWNTLFSCYWVNLSLPRFQIEEVLHTTDLRAGPASIKTNFDPLDKRWQFYSFHELCKKGTFLQKTDTEVIFFFLFLRSMCPPQATSLIPVTRFIPSVWGLMF